MSEPAMSEAVVDDIVAVLPPLLQSLEALGFIARHLNPPDFDRVMDAAGTPDQALQAVRSQLSDWPEPFAHVRAPLEAAVDAALAAFEGLRAVQHGHGDLVSRVSRVALCARARRRRCIRWPLTLPPVSEFFTDPAIARGRRSEGAARSTANAEHRDHSRPQRTRQPRRLLALRAGILHARPRLAAGDGAAWRQRQWPRLPVELAARRTQPWRHSSSPRPRPDPPAKTTWALMGEDSRYAEPRAHSRSGAKPLEHRFPAGCC